MGYTYPWQRTIEVSVPSFIAVTTSGRTTKLINTNKQQIHSSSAVVEISDASFLSFASVDITAPFILPDLDDGDGDLTFSDPEETLGRTFCISVNPPCFSMDFLAFLAAYEG